MIPWVMEHWTLLAGGGGTLPILWRLPRLVAWAAQMADCEWHRTQGLAREAALQTEIDRLDAALKRDLGRPGGTASSDDSATSTPTTRTKTRTSRR